MKIIAATLLAASIALTVVNAQSSQKPTKTDIDKWITELSNWSCWGKDDQFSALNLITPAKRKQAAALVKEGAPLKASRI